MIEKSSMKIFPILTIINQS